MNVLIDIDLPTELKRPQVALEVVKMSPYVHGRLLGDAKWRVHSVFDDVVNLINEENRIISLVTAEVGPGPFAMLLDLPRERPHKTFSFLDFLSFRTKVITTRSDIKLGQFRIDFTAAEIWDPRPRWHMLSRSNLSRQTPLLRSVLSQCAPADSLGCLLFMKGYEAHQILADSAWQLLKSGLATGDPHLCADGVRRMAGLGPGLTPAGDDFLMGLIYGIWAAFPGNPDYQMIATLLREATSRTTRLSAAWLSAAGRGEATSSWHDLINALADSCETQMELAAAGIINTGHTSGADAFTGFIAVIDELCS